MIKINHRLQTPKEGINQRNLKFWANVADKICFGRTYKFGIGIWFSSVQWMRFPHRASVVRGLIHGFSLKQSDNLHRRRPISLWTIFKSGCGIRMSQAMATNFSLLFRHTFSKIFWKFGGHSFKFIFFHGLSLPHDQGYWRP